MKPIPHLEFINEPTQTHMKQFEWNDESAQIFARLVLSVYKTKGPEELGPQAWKFDLDAYKRRGLTKKMEMFKADYVKQKTDPREQLDMFAQNLQAGMMASFDRQIREYKLQHGITD